MKIKFVFLFVFALSATAVFSQKVFQNLSYKDAIKKANETNKFVFLVYLFSDCKSCNDSITYKLKEDKIAVKLKKWFIPLKITADSKDRLLVQQSLNITTPAALYFIDGKSNIIFAPKYGTPISLDSVINEGIKRKKSIEFLQASEKKYFQSNTKDTAALKRMIIAKTALEQDTRLLLTEYINLIPKDSLNTIPVLQFIAKQSPTLESNADEFLRNSANFNDAWYDMPVAERIEINARTFKKSTQRAIGLRDINYLNKLVRFARATFEDEKGKTYIERVILMEYYWNTGDTSNYLSIADAFYNDYTNFVAAQATSNDAFAKEENKNLPSGLLNIQLPKAINYQTKWYAHYLFDAANFFYYVDKERKYRDDVIHWVATGLKLNSNYVAKHQYALLLYAAGRKEEAIQYETEAIKESRLTKDVFAKSWPKILEKMKANVPAGLL